MRLSFLLTLVAAMVIMGCSSSNPVTPVSNANAESNNLGLLGVYELTIDQTTMDVDMVAKRDMSVIGDSNLVSGLAFFTVAPCTNCFNLTNIGFDIVTSTLDLTYTINHPFDVGDPALPPRATNRDDLNVFDTALVVVPTGTAVATTFTAANVFAGYVSNAAGYTTELANVVGVGPEAMPFVLVVDDSIVPDMTYNAFNQGTSHDFDVSYSLTPGGDKLTFDLYLTMGYGAAALGKDKPTFLAPTYFNPEYNKKNAWKVTVEVPEDWVDLDPTAHPVIVSVYDWQQGAVVSTDWATETVSTAVRAASGVASVGLEVGLDTVVDLTVFDVTVPESTGMPDDPLEYTFMVINTNVQPIGVYMGLAIVTDERVAPTTLDVFDGTIHTDNGVDLTPYVHPGFVTYQVFDYEVIP